MIATAIYTGLRLSELLYLEWNDFDFGKEILTVKNKHEHDYKTKSKKFRIIPLNRKLIAILQPYRKEKGWCFTTSKGERYIQRPRKVFDIILEKAGLDDIGWHGLRHTFASQLIQAGTSIYKVSRWLGHSSVNTTMIYAHLAPGKDDDINKF